MLRGMQERGRAESGRENGEPDPWLLVGSENIHMSCLRADSLGRRARDKSHVPLIHEIHALRRNQKGVQDTRQ